MRRFQVCLALSLLATLMSTATPSAAHTSGYRDRNDTRGRLDISKVGVGHNGPDGVHHSITTVRSWKSSLLRDGSYVLFAFDLDGVQRTFEKCVYVVFERRLLALLTQCGRNVIDTLRVTRPNKRSVSVRIPDYRLKHKDVYLWAAFTRFVGKGCRKGCVDAAPNRRPLFLHDLERPTASLDPLPDVLSDVSTTPAFTANFSTADPPGGSGVVSWTFQRRSYRVGSRTWPDWTNSVSGKGAGDQSTVIDDAPAGRLTSYRVVAKDAQGNVKGSNEETVFVPLDDADIAVDSSWSSVSDPNAWMGSYRVTDDNADVMTISVPAYYLQCLRFQWIGPGDGTWKGRVRVDRSAPFLEVLATDVPDGSRQVLWQRDFCLSGIVEISRQPDGGSVPVDAIAMIPLDPWPPL